MVIAGGGGAFVLDTTGNTNIVVPGIHIALKVRAVESSTYDALTVSSSKYVGIDELVAHIEFVEANRTLKFCCIRFCWFS